MSRKVKYPRLRDMPYLGTKVAIEDSQAEINKLLAKYDITDYQWTKLGNEETVKFVIDTVVQGTRIRKAVQFDIPVIKGLYGRKQEVQEVPRKQVYRMFFYALKSMLESTKYGILKLEHVFLSYTLTQLSTGEMVTIKDVLDKHPLMLESGFNK